MKNVAKTVSKVSEITGIDEEEIYEKIVGKSIVKIKDRVSNEMKTQLEKAMDYKNDDYITGVSISPEENRFYPSGKSLPFVLGFVNSDGIGQYGIEASYNKELFGKSGKSKEAVNPLGQLIPFEKKRNSRSRSGKRCSSHYRWEDTRICIKVWRRKL